MSFDEKGFVNSYKIERAETYSRSEKPVLIAPRHDMPPI